MTIDEINTTPHPFRYPMKMIMPAGVPVTMETSPYDGELQYGIREFTIAEENDKPVLVHVVYRHSEFVVKRYRGKLAIKKLDDASQYSQHLRNYGDSHPDHKKAQADNHCHLLSAIRWHFTR